MADSNQPTAPTSNLPQYFNKLSQIYPRQTGNTTLNLFAQLASHIAPISNDSVIHDNASGPGTATTVLLAQLLKDVSPKITGTDMVPAMIEAFTSSFPNHPNISSRVINSQSLDFPDNHFTHSITNFSIFNFQDPHSAVTEVHRTLKPGGQAVVTTWKIFAIGDAIHEVQRRVRPDLPLMPFSGPKMYSGDAVSDVMIKAGFEKSSIEVLCLEHVVKSEELEGLIEFAKSPFTDSARKGWTESEKGRWDSVLMEVLNAERQKSGGLKFEGYGILAVK